MKASISGCKAVVRTAAGRLRQDWRVAADEPKQKGLDDGKPGCISRRDGDRPPRGPLVRGACASTRRRPLVVSKKNKTRKSPLQPSLQAHLIFL